MEGVLQGKLGSPQDQIVDGGHWQPRAYAQLPLHINDGLEIVLVNAGQARWLVDGVEHAVSAGQMFFTLPWQVHGSAEAVDPTIDLHWLVIPLEWTTPQATCCFPDRCGIPAALGAAVLTQLQQREQHCIAPTAACASLMPLTVAEFQSDTDDQYHRPMLASFLHVLIGELSRSLSQGTVPQTSPVPNKVIAAWSHICHHHVQPWTLASMAQQAHLGTSRFSACIRSLTGDSPAVALTRERLRAACQDLLSSSMPITQIALQHGFGSSQAFAKTFKQYCLQTPSAYRSNGGQFAPQFAPL